MKRLMAVTAAAEAARSSRQRVESAAEAERILLREEFWNWYWTEMHSEALKEGISMGADVVPGVDVVKGGAQVVTGKDAVTEHPTSRAMSGLQVIGGLIPLVDDLPKYLLKLSRATKGLKRAAAAFAGGEDLAALGIETAKHHVIPEYLGGLAKPLTESGLLEIPAAIHRKFHGWLNIAVSPIGVSVVDKAGGFAKLSHAQQLDTWRRLYTYTKIFDDELELGGKLIKALEGELKGRGIWSMLYPK
jgi:hypothetical protein